MAILADRRRRAEKRAQSLLFPTARPSSTGDKLVLNRIIRAKEVEDKALDLVVDGLLKEHKPGEGLQR